MPHSPPTYKPATNSDKKKKANFNYDQSRLPAHLRGYDHSWRKARSDFLQKHPLCEDCMKEGIYTQATDLHHRMKAKEHPHLFYDDRYWMPLCHSCHSKRTAAGE